MKRHPILEELICLCDDLNISWEYEKHVFTARSGQLSKIVELCKRFELEETILEYGFKKNKVKDEDLLAVPMFTVEWILPI